MSEAKRFRHVFGTGHGQLRGPDGAIANLGEYVLADDYDRDIAALRERAEKAERERDDLRGQVEDLTEPCVECRGTGLVAMPENPPEGCGVCDGSGRAPKLHGKLMGAEAEVYCLTYERDDLQDDYAALDQYLAIEREKNRDLRHRIHSWVSVARKWLRRAQKAERELTRINSREIL